MPDPKEENKTTTGHEGPTEQAPEDVEQPSEPQAEINKPALKGSR